MSLSAPSARRAFLALVATHVAIWTLIPAVTFPNAPLDVVEIALWGRDFEWGYAKHPPLASWLLDLARRVGGPTADWPVYLLGQLAIAAAFWATWRLANDLLDFTTALVALLLTECTLYYTWIGTETNHSVILLPFAALATWSFYRAVTTGTTWWWIALGVSLGVGALTKYTIGLLGASIALFLIGDPRARRSLQTAGPWIALLIAAAIFTPHAIWTIRHELTTLEYLSLRATNRFGLAGHVIHPLLFAGGQALYAGLPILAATTVIHKPWRLAELDTRGRFDRRILLVAVLGPAAMLCLAAAVSGMNLVTAWGFPLWSGLGVLSFCMLRPETAAPTRRLVTLALLLGAVNIAIALGQALLGPSLTLRGDRRHFPGRELAAHVDAIWTSRTGQPLQWVGGERWLGGNVAYYAPGRARLCSGGQLDVAYVDPAECRQDDLDAFRTRGGMLLWYVDREGADIPRGLRAHFPEVQLVDPVILGWRTRAAIPPLRIGIALVPPARRP